MDEQLRFAIEAIKQDMMKQVPGMRQANKVVPVSGQRHSIQLNDRELGMVYYPAKKENAPLILGFHGGGFLFGGSAMDDKMWCAVAEELEANVASIDYRMTPDFMWPAPIEDAYDSAIYLKEHASEYGFNPERISVMGSSAGGNIAAAVSLYAKDKGGIQFDYQILIYPETDQATDPAQKGDGSLSGPILYVFKELYVKDEDASNPYCSPKFATDEQMTGLPAAIVCVAEDDCLKAEGLEYAKRLKECGNLVCINDPEKGMPHGYFEYGFDENSGQDFLDESIKVGIKDGTIAKGAKNTLEYIKEHFYK